MPLSEQESLSLLEFQTQVRQVDSDLFERASRTVSPSTRPSEMLLSYLGTLIRLIAERSNRTYSETIALLNQNVVSEDGQRIEGVKVALSEGERIQYGAEEIDLADAVSYDAVLHELGMIWREIEEERRS